MDATGFMPGETALAKVRAEIDAYEADRARVLRGVQIRRPAYVLLVIVAVALLAVAFNSFANPFERWVSTPHLYLYLAGAVAAAVVFVAAKRPAIAFQQSMRDRMLPVIFGFIEDMRYGKGEEPASVARIPEEAIGSRSDGSYDDEISGIWQETPFELYEAVFSNGHAKTRRTIFRGVVIALKADGAFPGVLVATRKANTVTSFFQGIFGGDLDTIETDDAVLGQTYQFRTDNREAAQPLVNGRLTQALRWLGETWPDEPARIALRGDDVFLLLPHSKNFFELPGIAVPLDYRLHVVPMIADMATLLATASLVRQIGATDEPAPVA